MIQTGVRVTDLTALRLRDVNLPTTAAHIQVMGIRRKRRARHTHPRDRHRPARMACRTPRPARRPAHAAATDNTNRSCSTVRYNWEVPNTLWWE